MNEDTRLRERRSITHQLSSTKLLGTLTLLAIFSAAPLFGAAEGRVEKTFDTTREPRVSLANLRGAVLVRGWDKAQVHVTYSIGSPRVEVDTEVLPPTGAAEKVRFTTHVLDPQASGNEESANYTIEVPSNSNLEIRNPQGSIRVEGIQAQGSVESVSANIAIKDFSGHLSVRSVGGNIEILRPSGHVEAVSITGSLHFVSPATLMLRGSTTSGNILFEGDFTERGDYALSTYSGDLDVACPPRASFEVAATTQRGKVLNTLNIKPRHSSASPRADMNSLMGTNNTGRATVDLKSYSGTIRIHPTD
jgi:hypothetical protein